MSRKMMAILGVTCTCALIVGIWLLQLKTTSATWRIKETENDTFKKIKKDISEMKADFTKKKEKIDIVRSAIEISASSTNQ